MNDALVESIAHWAENLRRAKEGLHFCADGACCPLCEKYAGSDVPYAEFCNGCPVHEHTGRRGCEGTPWTEVDMLLFDHGPPEKERLVDAVEKELNFLRSLLEKPV